MQTFILLNYSFWSKIKIILYEKAFLLFFIVLSIGYSHKLIMFFFISFFIFFLYSNGKMELHLMCFILYLL